MPAYIVSLVMPKDASAFAAYRERAAASIAAHGGRYVVRGRDVETLEGAATPEALVIVEFPDRQRARAWYRSPEYAQALAFRAEALERRLVLVDGVGEPD